VLLSARLLVHLPVGRLAVARAVTSRLASGADLEGRHGRRSLVAFAAREG
jgi:hypothetical protein